MPNVDPTFVARDLVDPVRNSFPEVSIDEVVAAYRLWLAFRLPLLSLRLEVAD